MQCSKALPVPIKQKSWTQRGFSQATLEPTFESCSGIYVECGNRYPLGHATAMIADILENAETDGVNTSPLIIQYMALSENGSKDVLICACSWRAYSELIQVR